MCSFNEMMQFAGGGEISTMDISKINMYLSRFRVGKITGKGNAFSMICRVKTLYNCKYADILGSIKSLSGQSGVQRVCICRRSGWNQVCIVCVVCVDGGSGQCEWVHCIGCVALRYAACLLRYVRRFLRVIRQHRIHPARLRVFQLVLERIAILKTS